MIDLFSEAIKRHRTGCLANAEELYRLVLVDDPRHADSLHLLGVVAYQTGRHELAAEMIGKAIAVNATAAEYHCNLGNTLKDQQMLIKAVSSYRWALVLKPDHSIAYNNLGNALQEQRQPGAAIVCYGRAIALTPDFDQVHNNLGNAFQEYGMSDAAVGSYRAALVFGPADPLVYTNLGLALQRQGRLNEATNCYARVVSISPHSHEARNHLGTALQGQGQLAAAVASYQAGIALKPDHAGVYSNLGGVWQAQGRPEASVLSHRRAVNLAPGFAEAYNNLGNALQEQGRLEAAVDCFHMAIRLKPDYAKAHSNMLFCLNYHPEMTAEEIFAAYRRWDECQASSLLSAKVDHENSRDPARRLRIGYVSADFRRHSACHFIEPLLTHHNRAAVEVFAYAESALEDEVSERLKRCVDHWVRTIGMNDDALAARMRADRIDILVDLAGHTAGNRLLVFARKPAPLQVSWLGYGYTTGLSAMDYFLADAVLAPEGAEHLFSERLVRLPVCVAYRAAHGMGGPGPLPALSQTGITFGTLTRSVRINHRVVRVWSRILRRLPDSRLVINSRNFCEQAHRKDMAERFAEHGVPAHRLDLAFTSPPWDVLRSFDIGLDCFPHNSGTTLCEQLYLGVPTVTLAARPSVGRLGASLLTALGHPEWIAATDDEYVEKAVALAEDWTQLCALRTSLPVDMMASPLMDERAFAVSVEAAYRAMWKRWCADEPVASMVIEPS